MLFICTWLWGEKWGPEYPLRLFAAVKRNLGQKYRSVLISDYGSVAGTDLYRLGADVNVKMPWQCWEHVNRPGCLARMWVFSREFQAAIGAKTGDRIVNIDVDCVITDQLDPLFERDSEFTIMQGFNQTNPCPFNGSLWMFRAGERHDVWDDFSFENYKALGVPVHSVPDDQGWLHYKFPKAAAWTTADGVYGFKKIGWKKGRRKLPLNARLVAFPGRDPAKYLECDWIKQHWLGEPC